MLAKTIENQYFAWPMICAVALLAVLPSRAVHAQSCSGDALIDETLPSGSRWEMCWEHRAEEGIVLTDVHFTTPVGVRRQVLKSASVAQIRVAFDDGAQAVDLVSDPAHGLGGASLATIPAINCPAGSLRQNAGSDVLCLQQQPRGYAYKSYSVVKQGHMLSLWSLSSALAHAYLVRWDFYDDGSVKPSIGLTGKLESISSDPRYGWQLDNLGRIAVGFSNAYTWRLDFDLGASGADDAVDEMEARPSLDRLRKTFHMTELLSEVARPTDPEVKRSWRIRDTLAVNADGRAISYHLEPLGTAHQYQVPPGDQFPQAALQVTTHKDCERFATGNSTVGGCGAGAADFLSGEPINPADIVFWYTSVYHHLPRSEDEPRIPVYWNSVLIVPRDWTATNPLTWLAPFVGVGSAS